MATAYLYPSAEGTYTAGTAVGDTTKPACVDDPYDNPDDDATYVSVPKSGPNAKQSFVFDTSGLNANAKIRHVTVCWRARRLTSTQTHQNYIYYGGTLYTLGDFSIGVSYANYSYPVYFPPGGSAWWTPATLATLEFVLENNSTVEEYRLTQVYLKVEYDNPAQVLEGGYSTNVVLTVTNNSASQLDAGYSVLAAFTGDDASAIYNGSEESGNDVRITYDDGGGDDQIHREIEEFTEASVKIWFKLQANIPGDGSDDDYKIWYGKSGADSAPAGRTFIFSFPSQAANGQYIMEVTGDVRGHALTEFWQSRTTVSAKFYQTETTTGYRPFGDPVGTMRCLTDTGTFWTAGDGPELMLNFRKVGTNTLYLWTRGRGVSDAGDSYFPRIDSTNGTFHDLPDTGWAWVKANVTTAVEGVRSIGTRAREDGVIFDAIVLTEDNAYSISGIKPVLAALSVFRLVQDVEPSVTMGEIPPPEGRVYGPAAGQM